MAAVAHAGPHRGMPDNEVVAHHALVEQMESRTAANRSEVVLFAPLSHPESAPHFRDTVGNVNRAASRTYTKVARAEGEARTRTALIDAAQELFFDRGWASTSLDAVADAAGVTKQTLLRHFGTKDGLLEQAFAAAFEHVRDQRWEVAGDNIADAVDNLLDHYEAVGDRALKIDAMASIESVAPWVAQARQMHYDWVDRAFASFLTHPRRDRARRCAALIVLCDVHSWRLLRRQLGLSRAETRATLIGAITAILEGDA